LDIKIKEKMLMVEFALGMSMLSGILFLLLLASYILNWEKAKIPLSCIVSGSALLSMVLFCNMQKASGNPDMGKEFGQWYFPIMIYLFIIVFGIVSLIIAIIRKVKSR